MRPIPSDTFSKPLCFADLAMDLAAYRVRRAGRVVHLGPTEFRLLRHFLEFPRRVFTRQELLEAAWEDARDIEMRTVDAHILRLRRALNRSGGSDLIRTVRSIGYSLDEESD